MIALEIANKNGGQNRQKGQSTQRRDEQKLNIGKQPS
jgi:hypothetical protein